MFKTEQEKFWSGSFGNEYIQRNNDKEVVSSNIYLFSKILARTNGVESILELGSNIGLNILAIKNLLPNSNFSAVEINEEATRYLKKIDDVMIYNESILNFNPKFKWDFVLIKLVLIHINPQELKNIYKTLYETSNKYICICEYYNPYPVSVMYRGNEDKLFKRDFAGEIMDEYKDLKLIDYGFVYHRDNNFKQDDITWFLLEKI